MDVPTKEELLKVVKWMEETCPIMEEEDISKQCCGLAHLEEQTRQRRQGYEFAIEHLKDEIEKQEKQEKIEKEYYDLPG